MKSRKPIKVRLNNGRSCNAYNWPKGFDPNFIDNTLQKIKCRRQYNKAKIDQLNTHNNVLTQLSNRYRDPNLNMFQGFPYLKNSPSSPYNKILQPILQTSSPKLQTSSPKIPLLINEVYDDFPDLSARETLSYLLNAGAFDGAVEFYNNNKAELNEQKVSEEDFNQSLEDSKGFYIAENKLFVERKHAEDERDKDIAILKTYRKCTNNVNRGNRQNLINKSISEIDRINDVIKELRKKNIIDF